MSLEKRKVLEGWILGKIDGLQCSINCPEIKWGSTLKWIKHFTSVLLLISRRFAKRAMRAVPG